MYRETFINFITSLIQARIEWKKVNPFQNKPLLWSTNLLKTLWEKKKLLLTSYGFSKMFTTIPKTFFESHYFDVCKCFHFDWLIDGVVFYTPLNIISVMYSLGFTSTRLGLCSVLPKDTPTIKPRGSRTPELQVKYFTIEPCQTPVFILDKSEILSFVFCQLFQFRKVKYYTQCIVIL